MNTNIDPIVSKYIDVAIERERKMFSKQSNQHMTDLKTFFSVELGKVLEAVNDRPTRADVREIVQEEIKPLKVEVHLIKKEVSEINKKLDKHDVRLTRLENVLV